jgi:hypothetical protein
VLKIQILVFNRERKSGDIRRSVVWIFFYFNIEFSFVSYSVFSCIVSDLRKSSCDSPARFCSVLLVLCKSCFEFLIDFVESISVRRCAAQVACFLFDLRQDSSPACFSYR